ncbi:hypothetical protein [Raineyella sp.]|nr:hypothetical protein [Raineyella sp.]MEA5155585.1 hypothetical protein [Raineyella sp.]
MFSPPDTEEARAVWAAGRADARQNRPKDSGRYTVAALRAMYLQGYAWGRQESLQAKYGDPPTA